MAAQLISNNGDAVTIQITVDLSGTLLEAEGRIQEACNQAGMMASAEALKRFDTDGAPIVLDAIKWTKRCAAPKKYQTPYGEVEIVRNVYQTSKGGRIDCPLEAAARIIRHATPRFAQQLSHKYAQTHVHAVCADLRENHGRQIAASYVQNVADWVGGIAEAQEAHWEYAPPDLDRAVATVAISLDGAMLAMKEAGWREAMVGSVSLDAPDGERLHTLSVGEAPESGKATFKPTFRTTQRVIKNASITVYQRKQGQIEHEKRINCASSVGKKFPNFLGAKSHNFFSLPFAEFRSK